MITRRSLLGAGALALPLAAAPALPAVATAAETRRRRWSGLSGRLHGTLVLPGDPAYGTAKQIGQTRFDSVEPAAVAYCADEADVALCLRYAQDRAVPIAVRSGGHSAAGYSTGTGLVVDVSRLNGIAVGAGSVTLGTGAQLVDVTNGLAPYGLAVSGGFCPTVALGGFLQGGGIGLLTRHVGVSSDTVTAARVVLADGRTVTASADRHEDLYWAIRGGGGGNFGVVTSYTVAPTTLTALAVGTLAWGPERAAAVLDAWAHWLVDAPRTIGGAAVVVLGDAAPGRPPTVSVLLSSVGTEAELTAQTDRLVDLVGAAPIARSGFGGPYHVVMNGLYGCGTLTQEQCHRAGTGPAAALPRPAYAVERSRLFPAPPARRMWEDAVALLDRERVPGQQHLIQVGALGGAANDLPRTATAYVHRDALFSTSFLGVIAAGPADEAATGAARRWTDAGFAVLDPHSNGETYQNFVDPELRDWAASYYAENYPRLVAAKHRYDPYRLFRFPQAIGGRG
ncbi:twin-arginine translocation pathway signal [Streptomyces sp. XY431]|uniref:FAD-binding oxidoreductase n=1 Tax=Streptomyces sp. XY431 TaxID=1415562 RepID=UPI0006AE6263|nr:FAD-binding oxidoreductase [Streptomyces sp. XY431]KOV10324.1 twin-arginine translocation pathway signal [Streptomyces sp. XY431]